MSEVTRRSVLRTVGAVIGAVAAVALLLSCGEDDNASASGPIGTWVGKVSDSNAYIAVVAGRSNVVGWICDGEKAVGLRFTGPRLGNGFDITLPTGARLAGTITENRTTGAVTTGADLPRTFTAELAKGNAGLWTATDGEGDAQVRHAWVVLNDRSQRGASVSRAGVSQPTTLNTGTRKFPRADGTEGIAARTNPGGGGGGFQFGGGFNGFGGQQLGAQFQGGGQFQQGFGQQQGGGQQQQGGAQFQQGGGQLQQGFGQQQGFQQGQFQQQGGLQQGPQQQAGFQGGFGS